MKEINFRVPKSFGVRSNINVEMLPKREFFSFEGSKAEEDYFNGIFNYKKRIRYLPPYRYCCCWQR